MDTSIHPPLTDLGKNLLEAARYGNEQEVRKLLTKGASFTTDWLGTSPLHLAAQNGHLNTALLLMRAGMSCSARTKVDKTPLHLATQYGCLDLVKAFVKQGSDVNAVDMLRMTPLHWACVKNYKDISQFLIQNGADRTLKNKFDKTPLDICMDEGHLGIADILKDIPNTDKSNVQSCDITSIFAQNVSQSNEPLQNNLLASLSALAGLSGGFSSSPVTLDELSRLQASSASMPISPLDNVRSFILTDAGRLAMQFWNKTLESDSVTVNRKQKNNTKKDETIKYVIPKSKDSLHSCISKENPNSSYSVASENMSEYINTTESPPCSREDNDLLLIPSSSVGSLSFSNIFSDCSNNNRNNSENDDTCALDLERDILERQLENAKRAASRFREESRRKETEAERYRLQLEMLCEKKSKNTLCENS